MEKSITNPRKNKRPYTIWLTEEEERVLNQYITSKEASLIAHIIKKANERGDFEKR